MAKRQKTKYPGVFYREATRIGGKGKERVYYIVFKKDGKLLEEKVGRQYADDMTPARAAAIRGERIEGKRQSRKEIREAEKARKEAEKGKWTVERLWNAYRKHNPNLKGWPTYISLWNVHIKSHFAQKEPKEILPLDIHRVKNSILKNRSPQLAWHALALLRRIINFGVKNQLCKGLNFTIDMPKVDNEKTEDLTSEQLDRLLIAIENDFHPHAGRIMKMALFTGMRRGEIFKLKFEHIDFDRGFIRIVDPKGGPDQKIPLNEATRNLLESVDRTESPFVFPGKDGGRRTNIRNQVNRIKEAAGLPKDFRPIHGLRHVYASMLASSGEVDLLVLQKLLTHKDPKMTQRYAHLRDEALKRAANVTDNIINMIGK